MPFTGLQIVTADQLNRLQPITYSEMASSALTVTTTTDTDIPGCSITLTTGANNATYVASAIFDCDATVTNATTLIVGKLFVDGAAALGTSTYAMDTALRATIAEMWVGTLATAGSHTLKLTGALNVAAGTGVFRATNTKITVTITEVV